MGRRADPYPDHDDEKHHGKPRLDGGSFFAFPRLTPASVIGMGLFVFFAAQLFTTTPFQRFGGASRKLAEETQSSTGRVWTGSFLKVSKRSHAYLREVFWNRTTDTFTANVTSSYEDALAARRQQVRAGWCGTGGGGACARRQELCGGCPGPAAQAHATTESAITQGTVSHRPSPHPRPPARPPAMLQLAGEPSFYMPWIQQDLAPWKEAGITKVQRSRLFAGRRAGRGGEEPFAWRSVRPFCMRALPLGASHAPHAACACGPALPDYI